MRGVYGARFQVDERRPRAVRRSPPGRPSPCPGSLSGAPTPLLPTPPGWHHYAKLPVAQLDGTVPAFGGMPLVPIWTNFVGVRGVPPLAALSLALVR